MTGNVEENILVLGDHDNIAINAKRSPPEKFDLKLGFQRLEEWLKKKGKIAGRFMFVPDNMVQPHLPFYRDLGYIVIPCERQTEKLGLEYEYTPGLAPPKPKDTADDNLLDFGEWMLKNMPRITAVCICSGDRHMIRLAGRARRMGKKVFLMAGSERSLSTKLIPYASKDRDEKPIIHIFSPIED